MLRSLTFVDTRSSRFAQSSLPPVLIPPPQHAHFVTEKSRDFRVATLLVQGSVKCCARSHLSTLDYSLRSCLVSARSNPSSPTTIVSLESGGIFASPSYGRFLVQGSVKCCARSHLSTLDYSLRSCLVSARSNPSSPTTLTAFAFVGEVLSPPPYDRTKTCCLTAWRLPNFSPTPQSRRLDSSPPKGDQADFPILH
jgi:hypothetical protein